MYVPCASHSPLWIDDQFPRTPETFDIVTNTVNVASRKNLAQISRILTQITSGVEFGDDKPSYVPINDYVRKAIAQMTTWLLEGMLIRLHLNRF